jgi:NAD(P)-dependent dehydrogenase (short-subunit alcohol dehydrogenase family)
MTDFPYGTALIVGAGPGISASLARQLSARGVKVAFAARSVDKLKGLANDTGAKVFSTPTRRSRYPSHALFDDVADAIGDPDVVIYNASGRVRGPIDRARSCGSPAGNCGQRVRRFPGVPAGGKTHDRRAAGVRSCLPAPRQASRDFRNRRRSRWASSRFVALPKVRRANSGRMEFTSRISSSTAPSAPRRDRKIPTSLMRCSTPMLSPRAISTFSCRGAAHGRMRSSSDPGPRPSDGIIKPPIRFMTLAH